MRACDILKLMHKKKFGKLCFVEFCVMDSPEGKGVLVR